MTIETLKSQRETAIAKADSILRAAENAGRRPLTKSETQDFDRALAETDSLTSQIAQAERGNVSMQARRSELDSLFKQAKQDRRESGPRQALCPRTFSREYFHAVSSLLGGGAINAALYEGDLGLGGNAVPVEVDGTIVPLATEDSAIRQLATVITTTADRRIATVTTKTAAAVKAESGGSDHSFSSTGVTLGQKTLASFQIGGEVVISVEIAQDTPSLDSLLTDDLADAVTTAEEPLFISGSGVGEPEGVLTGADFGVANEDMDLDRILDLTGTLKAVYLRNANFLMRRSTAIVVRKNILSANVAGQVWTRDADGTERLWGFPVNYSESMPAIEQGASPLLFGDFRRGFVIGDRGGSQVNVKVLDQARLLEGQLVVLAFRRTDSRVRRSEALKRFVIDSAS